MTFRIFGQQIFTLKDPQHILSALIAVVGSKRRMLLKLFCVSFLLLTSAVKAQQNTLLLHTFFKDRYFLHAGENKQMGSGFFPVTEADFDLNRKIADSSKQYYDLTEIIFKKHLFEAKGKDYYLTISPIVDLSIGRDLADTIERRLFQNTRGVFVEGDLLKNFSFSTLFYENQARLAWYETDYYSSVGELYPNQSSGKYSTQNAVIPGAARTKPFKIDGFDYAYAQGNMVYRLHKAVTLSAGNTPQFVGDGYRSLLLSDNSIGSPFLRGDFRFSSKISFTYLRSRVLNLMRKPVSSTVESYYEAKGLAVNYLTWKPIQQLAISLFESTIWSRGDSLESHFSNPLIYNPVPIAGQLLMDEMDVSSITGLNVSFQLAEHHRLYGQFALTDLDVKKSAFQLGYRGYNYFGLKDLMFQLEYNDVASGMYLSSNRRLNYVHSNLPLAHPKGNSFREFVLRSNYEYKRGYIDFSAIYYHLKNYSTPVLLPVERLLVEQSGSVFIQKLELGYRFNRKINLSIFGSWLFRNESLLDKNMSSIFSLGLRTGINNHYNDF